MGKQWTGIRRHGLGWEASVYVSGAGRAYEPFPLETPPDEMQAWRRKMKAQMEIKIQKRGPNRPAAGSFAADAREYLKSVKAMPTFRERAVHIGLWVELFGDRRRDNISAAEIRAQRDEWLLHGPKRVQHKAVRDDDGTVLQKAHIALIPAPLTPSTVNKRLRALSNMWAVLDGPSAYNPVREVPECEEGDGEPRGIPWIVAQAIMQAMPDRGRGFKGEKRTAVSHTKARLWVLYWTGLAHKQLKHLRPKDVDLTAGTLYLERRRKGKGAPGHTRPLLPEAIEAFKVFDALKLWGYFSSGSMRKSFLRACESLGLEGLRVYDFRHGMGTDVYAATGDLKAVQEALGHASLTTSMRYMKGAVSPVMLAAVAKVSALRQQIAAANTDNGK